MTRVAILPRTLRRLAGRIRREMFPSPELAAWQRACELADRTPRRTPGRIQLAGYDVEYPDLLTTCPQWHDLFVRETLRFHATSETPRVIDCGANIGFATLAFKRAHPRARITAFEADPQIAAMLRRNLQVNGAADVEVVHAAVWTAEGTVRFRIEGTDSGAIAEGSGGHVADVPSVRLRDYLGGARVDLLKVDIEGAELEVLRDCADLLGNVDAILLDVHEFDPCRRQTGEIVSLLTRAGFQVAFDELVPLPWRAPTAAPGTAFAGTALCWAMLVRAWREPGRPPA